MTCKKCGNEMKMYASVTCGGYLRNTYGCCGSITTVNEDKPEVMEKYKMPSPDEVHNQRVQELKKLNTSTTVQQIPNSGVMTDETVMDRCKGTGCNGCRLRFNCAKSQA